MKENINELIRLLRSMEALNPDIQGSAIVSIQGLSICSNLSNDINHELISAICAAIVSISNYAVKELYRGELKRILIEGVDGIIILSKAGKNAILCTLARHEANLYSTVQNFNKKPPTMKDTAYVE